MSLQDLEFIGYIGPQESSESLAPRGPVVDHDFIRAFAQAQQYGGFDKALLAVSSASPDSFALAAWVAALTDRLGLLVAQRPGFIAPTMAARQLATLDQLSRGRVAVNVITGGDGGDLQRDGDWLDHDARYARTDEYLTVMRQTWTATEAFDHHGTHYRIQDNLTLVKPLQQPQLPIYFSGASPAAVQVAARHADVYMMWGEPLADIRQRVAQVREVAASVPRERPIRFSLSLRPIVADTEAEAWARAERILAAARARQAAQVGTRRGFGQTVNVGSDRLVAAARQAKVHDKRLWTEIAALTGAAGNSTALVGTAEQVAESVQDYWDAGITSFLFRGFDPLIDATVYGQQLLPAIRRRLAAHTARP